MSEEGTVGLDVIVQAVAVVAGGIASGNPTASNEDIASDAMMIVQLILQEIGEAYGEDES